MRDIGLREKNADMSEIVYKKKMLYTLEEDLNVYDKIVVLAVEKDIVKAFTASLVQAAKQIGNMKKIMLYTTCDMGKGDIRLDYRMLNLCEMEQLKELYFMYEFSDRLLMVSVETQFGSLLNYFNTGILTEEQAVEALLI